MLSFLLRDSIVQMTARLSADPEVRGHEPLDLHSDALSFILWNRADRS